MVKIPEDAQKVYDEYEGTNPKNLDKKIELLTKYLKMIQDIKGTERVQAINLNKLNALKKKKDEIERIQKKKKGKSKSDPFSIKKSEEIQIALVSRFFEIGVGKTTLLRNLTRAGDRLVGIPTNEPLIGVYQWQNIPFRLIELPALKEGYSAGVGNGPKIFSILRNCDLIALCIDLSIEPISQVNFILKQFEDVNIRINQKVPPIEIEKTGAHGIQVFFQSDSAKESIDLKDDIVELVNSSGLKNARIKIMGQISLQDVIDALNPGVAYKKAIIIATKGDSKNSKLNYNKLMETFGAPLDKDVVPADSKSPPKFHIFPVSIV
ncbi:MAG: GTPase, partial [Promethearchaeota archaeon]